MNPAPGSGEGWDKPITLDLGVLADERVSSGVVLGRDCRTFLRSIIIFHHYLHVFLYPQLEEYIMTLQGHQCMTLKDSRNGLQGQWVGSHEYHLPPPSFYQIYLPSN